MILSNTMTGDLWVPVPGGEGHIHLGTYHMDTNEFHEVEEDGIYGSIIDVDAMIDGQEIVLKGFWKITKVDFCAFRDRFLNAKYPSIDWYGGRKEIPGVPQWHPLDTD